MTDTPKRRLVVNLRESRPIWDVPAWALDEILAAVPEDWETVVLDEPADSRGDGGKVAPGVLEAVRGAEVYFGYGVPAELFEAAGGGLRWVHSAAAGVGGSLHEAMRASDVVFTNSAGVHAEPIADTVMAMVFHFARGLDFAVRLQAEARWDQGPFLAADAPVRELSECTLGLLGLGGIGEAVARRALALGMRVTALRRSEKPGPDGVELFRGEGALERMLPELDYLVVTVPQTEKTKGMVGAREIGRLPERAVIVNVARGGVVDEGAMTEALREKRIRGAGLDVFAEEPLPAGSPLWGLPNVLVTPHVSGTSHRFWRRQTDLVAGNLRRYLAGAPLLNTVDKQAGY
ncbi:MAG TPA: D-2-hydroxyacid dehydrogenase [Gemmatimonadales bacterium]|nr:D-2-hydroxyacid dehydrogenase [Gemmatimonadales bacterium]